LWGITNGKQFQRMLVQPTSNVQDPLHAEWWLSVSS
jgi:hypothetical protein